MADYLAVVVVFFCFGAKHTWMEKADANAKVRLALRWSVTKAVLSYAMKREKKKKNKHES